jgi:hypothetical protein
MKKIIVSISVLFLFVLSAYKAVDYLTTKQMKDYSSNIVRSYNWGNNHRLCLAGITGYDLKFVIDTSDQYEINYSKWVKGVVLKNRTAMINQITEKHTSDMLGYINESAIEAKMTPAGRDSLFKELKIEINFYLDKLTKLQTTTADKRKAIFLEASKIAPRRKAYMLQGDGPSEPPTSSLVKSQKNLRKLLAEVGITLPVKCDDFFGYSFTRHSKHYDYLFSLSRWAAYIDGGKTTDEETTGWKEETIKALIDDGIIFLKKQKKVVDAYKIT